MRRAVFAILARVFLGLLLAGAWGPKLSGIVLTSLLVPSIALAGDEDDDRDDRPRPRERETREPERQPPGILQNLQRDWKAGAIWVVQRSNRQQTLRIGLEYQGRTIAAITLDPNTGEPIPYESRNSTISNRPLTQAQLSLYLNQFRSQLSRLTIGQFGLPSSSGVQFPIYWNNRLVGYVRFDSTRGQVLPDTPSANEIQTSPLKLR
jgi:hypothetical protein